ncbi:MAG: nucleotidyltransferase domain-containing protein [Fimbriimonadaceae bacterium]|nr:nucleotidyltransferase domain-containing protein [Fimbriimonadaceae bacterium]
MPKQWPQDTIETLHSRIVYRCVIGSHAYGLDTDASDTDIRGCFLPPASMHWSLDGVPEQLENDERQECFWEFGKFVKLALQNNPNVLECLFTPLSEPIGPVGKRLVQARDAFPSKLAHGRYRGYVEDQMRRLDNKLKASGEIKWRHAMHMIRLLISGLDLMETGRVRVDVSEHRDELLAIRAGQVSWELVLARADELSRKLDEAYNTTSLPAQPDYALVNNLLLQARREALDF